MSNRQGKLDFKADAHLKNSNISKSPSKNKRLTIDIPESLHRAIKSQCALQGVKMTDVIRAGLLKKYGAKDLD